MGGIAYQRLTIAKTDFVRMLSRGLDIKGEASGTFKAVKAGAKGNLEDKTDTDFKTATQATRNRINYAGGTNNANFDQFVLTVADNPTAIALSLVALYELLTPVFFPQLDDLDARRTIFQRKMESYFSSNGTDLTRARLRFGAVVRLDQAGMNRSLGSGQTFASARAVPNSRHTPSEFLWKLVRADDPGYTGDVDTQHPVALRSIVGNAFLDAAGGRDDEYARGIGLTGLRGTDPGTMTAQWRIRLVDGLRRSAAVEGDMIRIETVGVGRNGKTGYLYGEESGAHRVFSFAGDARSGTIWQIIPG
jgi:hypothetical protein